VLDYDLTRREFIEVSAALTVTMAALSDTHRGHDLNAEERDTLIVMIRTVFPHTVRDNVYRDAVEVINLRCRNDPATFVDVTAGVAALEAKAGNKFSRLPEAARISLLTSIEGSAFFRVVVSEALESLYGSSGMWTMFLKKR